ncbi:unnamed protein product [Schistosoma guineensis]|uniref:GLOBIN domain-containing protein n=2 Tax=Schistosoma TaxID=6181 RepID=A0A183LHE9_9TREM|nr:unnamed protein product [Schistosoma guineensis]CAH8656696.1 unnamed protein product [Schistosoma margrebowiei]CAH8662514.1 unnamed protein product [Schistosoma bovis]CAI2736007.1 unnamed protein product [Schistosoma spindale]VDP24763.1 unnamed protein product [Schistosoma curassoni]
MRMEQRKHSSLLSELENILSTNDRKIKVGKEIFRQLLIKNPHYMKMYKPLQSVTLPQALNLDYLTKMAICYVDNIMKIVRNFNEEEKLQETVKYLAAIHTNRGLTVAHFVSILPIFTDTIVSYMEIDDNKESMQFILSTVFPMIGKRL